MQVVAYSTIVIHLMERSGFVMISADKYIYKLNEIDELTIFVDANGMICVRFANYDIKDGCVIRSAIGRGTSLLFALQNFVKEISGQTLINIRNDESNKEVRVLIIETGVKCDI